MCSTGLIDTIPIVRYVYYVETLHHSVFYNYVQFSSDILDLLFKDLLVLGCHLKFVCLSIYKHILKSPCPNINAWLISYYFYSHEDQLCHDWLITQFSSLIVSLEWFILWYNFIYLYILACLILYQKISIYIYWSSTWKYNDFSGVYD